MMKLIKAILMSSLFAPAITFAGPNASGGIPETAFQHDRAAVTTIFDDLHVLEVLSDKGSILSILPLGKDVFVVTTQKCQLAVQFVRKCVFAPGEMPQCDYTANILPQQSSAGCGL